MGGKKGQWSKRISVAKVAGLYREEKLGEGQPSPSAGEFREGVGYASQEGKHCNWEGLRVLEEPGSQSPLQHVNRCLSQSFVLG